MSDPIKKILIEKIATRTKCSTCGRRYRAQDVTVLEEQRSRSVLRLACAECRTQRVLVVALEKRRAKSFLSELEPEEWMRFRRGRAVDRDDVITIHRTLFAYDGDLSEVLEDPLPPESRDE